MFLRKAKYTNETPSKERLLNFFEKSEKGLQESLNLLLNEVEVLEYLDANGEWQPVELVTVVRKKNIYKIE